MKIACFYILSVFFLFFAPQKTQAQNSFSVNDTAFYITKDISFGVIHWYVQLTNTSNTDSLLMRWKLSISGNYPSNWVFDTTDPNNIYTNVADGDSADFYLDTTSFSTNKIIFSLDHKQIPGEVTLSYLLYPVNNLSDSIRVNFYITINDLSSEISLFKQLPDNSVTYYRLYSITGNKIKETQYKQNLFPLPATTSTGIYIVEEVKDGKTISYRKIYYYGENKNWNY